MRWEVEVVLTRVTILIVSKKRDNPFLDDCLIVFCSESVVEEVTIEVNECWLNQLESCKSKADSPLKQELKDIFFDISNVVLEYWKMFLQLSKYSFYFSLVVQVNIVLVNFSYSFKKILKLLYSLLIFYFSDSQLDCLFSHNSAAGSDKIKERFLINLRIKLFKARKSRWSVGNELVPARHLLSVLRERWVALNVLSKHTESLCQIEEMTKPWYLLVWEHYNLSCQKIRVVEIFLLSRTPIMVSTHKRLLKIVSVWR